MFSYTQMLNILVTYCIFHSFGSTPIDHLPLTFKWQLLFLIPKIELGYF